MKTLVDPFFVPIVSPSRSASLSDDENTILEDEIRATIFHFFSILCLKVTCVVEHARRMSIRASDVVYALEQFAAEEEGTTGYDVHHLQESTPVFDRVFSSPSRIAPSLIGESVMRIFWCSVQELKTDFAIPGREQAKVKSLLIKAATQYVKKRWDESSLSYIQDLKPRNLWTRSDDDADDDDDGNGSKDQDAAAATIIENDSDEDEEDYNEDDEAGSDDSDEDTVGSGEQ